MEERVDIWDKHGKPTGRSALKSEAHIQGWFHPVVHVWFYTANGKILLQQRATSKETFPGLWDVSVAGHVMSGEKIGDAALREIEEEIGLVCPLSDLTPVAVVRSEQEHPGGIRDCEFHHIFIAKLTKELKELLPQQGEVQALKLMALTQFAEETWGLGQTDKYVPHGIAYYEMVIRKIKELLLDFPGKILPV